MVAKKEGSKSLMDDAKKVGVRRGTIKFKIGRHRNTIEELVKKHGLMRGGKDNVTAIMKIARIDPKSFNSVQLAVSKAIKNKGIYRFSDIFK